MLEGARRVVVKIGSSLLLRDGRLDRPWLERLADDVAERQERGQSMVLVSSGAVGLGRGALGSDTNQIADRQAAAAIGQVRLSEAYRAALARRAITTAQVLLTPGDTEDRRRHLNARATIETLLGHSIIPVINENDTVATDELKFGDNDRLASRVAQLVSADLVVLLSDVDGLYTADPRIHHDAQHVPVVHAITPTIEAMAGEPGTPLGTGGMASKLEAARIALAAGAYFAIAPGLPEGALASFFNGGRATWFLPSVDSLTARKAWIAATLTPRGRVVADSGALRAVQKGGSLLTVGVLSVGGGFRKGDPVRLVSEDGEEAGVGLVNYDEAEAALIAGHRSDRLLELLGYDGPDVLIHRDNLVVAGSRDPTG